MKRLVLFSAAMLGLAGVFAWNVSADSTLSIPLPDKAMQSKEVTLTLRIPPNTQPVTKGAKLKMVSRNALYTWDANPVPNMANSDELLEVLRKFDEKGWVKGMSRRTLVKMRPMTKYHGITLIQHVVNNILEIGQSPNVVRTIRKSNLQASDIEDLRRMVAKYSADLKVFNMNVTKEDKDLLMLQEQYKTAKSGIMKVIKVEGMGDGSTVIQLHME